MASNSYAGGGDKKLTSGSNTSAIVAEFETERGLIDAAFTKVEAAGGQAAVRIGSIGAGTDDERAIFVAPADVTVTGVTMVVATSIATDGTNFTDITVQNKGSDGSGTTDIATFNNDSGGAAQTMTAFDGFEVTGLSVDLTAGDVLSFTKTDTASGTAVDELLVVIFFAPQA